MTSKHDRQPADRCQRQLPMRPGMEHRPRRQRKQHRFYLGRNRYLAQFRALAIEGIWTAIEKKT